MYIIYFSAVSKVPTVTTMDFLDPSSHDTSGTATPTQMAFTAHVKRDRSHMPKLAFVSAQLEKVTKNINLYFISCKYTCKLFQFNSKCGQL